MCSNEELRSMCDHYSTTVGECNCSDNKHESANFEIDIPCCHLFIWIVEFETSFLPSTADKFISDRTFLMNSGWIVESFGVDEYRLFNDPKIVTLRI